MRTISAAFLAAQYAASRTPYIKMLMTSKDGLTTKDFSTDSAVYGNRILLLDHHEEAYNDYAIVALRDWDASNLIPAMKGYWTEIGYGLNIPGWTEKDSYTTTNAWQPGPDEPTRIGMGFQAASSYTIKKVALSIKRDAGYSPGELTVDIHAQAGGVPTGLPLCSGHINGNSLSTSLSYVDVELGDGAALVSGTYYTIVIRAPDYGILWDGTNAGAPGTGKCYVYSLDGGVGWVSVGANGMDFKTYASAAATDTVAGAYTSRLWVKHQRHITAGGKLYTILELEGMWAKVKETLLRLGSAPTYTKDYPTVANETLYDLMGIVLNECGMTVDALGGVDDGLIDTLIPTFGINSNPFEYADGVIYRLIRLTECYLRSQMTLAFKVVHPQAADAANETYTSDESGYPFYIFMERVNALTPNHFVLFGNRGTNGMWGSMITSSEASGSDTAEIAALYDIYKIILAPDITDQTELNNVAAAQLARARAEQDTGMLTIPHDARVELYDKVSVVDNRPAVSVTYPTNSLTRVSGLHHIYRPGKYDLEIFLGGVSNTNQEDEYSASNEIQGISSAKKAVLAAQTATPTFNIPAPRPFDLMERTQNELEKYAVPPPTTSAPPGPHEYTFEEVERISRLTESARIETANRRFEAIKQATFPVSDRMTQLQVPPEPPKDWRVFRSTIGPSTAQNTWANQVYNMVRSFLESFFRRGR